MGSDVYVLQIGLAHSVKQVGLMQRWVSQREYRCWVQMYLSAWFGTQCETGRSDAEMDFMKRI